MSQAQDVVPQWRQGCWMLNYRIVLLDWADTVMVDTDPTSPLPMCEWKDLRLVPGARHALEAIAASGRTAILATSAQVSTEPQIREALARVDVDHYFKSVFCQRNTGLPKSEAFYRHIVSSLGVAPTEVVMVGDSLAKDIVPAIAAGISAIWLNQDGKNQAQAPPSALVVTSMDELATRLLARTM